MKFSKNNKYGKLFKEFDKIILSNSKKFSKYQ